jgi:hypothetical protein
MPGTIDKPWRRKKPGVASRRCGALPAHRRAAPLALAPQHQRHLAAGPVQVRLDHLQHEAAGHGGIEGIAAALQHAHGGLRGEPVGGAAATPKVPVISGRVVKSFMVHA